MATYVVWVLILTSNYNGSHFGVVDNIASQENCRALAKLVLMDAYFTTPRCIAVRKVKP